MPEVIIIRGPAGFGKSTYAKSKYVSQGYDHWEADMYHYIDGKYQWKVENLGKSHAWCFEQFKRSCEAEHNVVVSNTFTTHKELAPYVEYCKLMDIPYKIIRCTKNYGNIHNVPEDKVQQMINRMQDYEGEELV